jgi:hypothetical protein
VFHILLNPLGEAGIVMLALKNISRPYSVQAMFGAVENLLRSRLRRSLLLLQKTSNVLSFQAPTGTGSTARSYDRLITTLTLYQPVPDPKFLKDWVDHG